MCGLITVAGNITHDGVDRFAQLVTVSYVRGEDATGVAGIFKNETKLHKRATSARYFFWSDRDKLKPILDHMAYALIGHVRAATTGTRDGDASAHPFVSGNITGMHNGHIGFSDLKDLPERFNNCPTDSEEIIRNINKHGYAKTLEFLKGAYALVWFDRKDSRLYFTRNDKRTLFYALNKARDTIWIHSERDALKWILERDTPKETYTYAEVEPGKVYSMYITSRGASDLKSESVTMGKFKPFIAVETPTVNNVSTTTNERAGPWKPAAESAKVFEEAFKSGNSSPVTSRGSMTPPTTRTPLNEINDKLPLNEPDSFFIEGTVLFMKEEIRTFGIAQLRDYRDALLLTINKVTSRIKSCASLSSMNWADAITWRGNLKKSSNRILTDTAKLWSDRAKLQDRLSFANGRIKSYEQIKQAAVARKEEVLENFGVVVAPEPNKDLGKFKTMANVFPNVSATFEYIRKAKGCACCGDDNPVNFLVANSVMLEDGGFVCSTCAESPSIVESILEPRARRA